MKQDLKNQFNCALVDSIPARNIVQVPHFQLLEEIKQCYKAEEAATIAQAARLLEAQQPLASGLNHVSNIHIAHIMAVEMDVSVHMILTGLLYQSATPQAMPKELIINHFGQSIWALIQLAQEVQPLFVYRKKTDLKARLQLIYEHLSEHTEILFLKIAENLARMRFTCEFPKLEHMRIAAESSLIYVPITQRLGLNRIKRELDTLALKYLHPFTYYMIEEKMTQLYDIGMHAIQLFEQRIGRILQKKGVRYSLHKRIKAYASIWRKMKEKGRRFEDLHDIFAARIILHCKKTEEEEKKLCWEVYHWITDYYQPVPGRLHDWIAHPKPNGYQSLHITLLLNKHIRMELQIRSTRMHQVAEYGSASHNRYKELKEQENYLNAFDACQVK